MKNSSDLALLDRHFGFVSRLSVAGRALLSRALTFRKAKATTQLVCRGDEIGGVILVLAGSIRVYFVHPSGQEGTLYFVDPGDACFLSVQAAVRARPYGAWAESDLEPVQFALVPADCFQELLKTEPVFQEFVVEVLSGRVSQMMQTIEATAACALEARLARFLLDRSSKANTLRSSQERLARHLGTSREVLVRLLRVLRNQALVETERGVVRIVDREGLEKLAHTN